MTPVSVAFDLLETIDSFRLDVTLRQAAQGGVITAADKSHWLAELTETLRRVASSPRRPASWYGH